MPRSKKKNSVTRRPNNQQVNQGQQGIVSRSSQPAPTSTSVPPNSFVAQNTQESAAINKIIDERIGKGEFRIYAINPSNSIVGKSGEVYSAPAEGDTMMVSSDYLTPEAEARYYSVGAIRLAYESVKPKGRRFSNEPVESRVIGGVGSMRLQDDQATFNQANPGMPILRPQ